MTSVTANEIALGIESFGDDDATRPARGGRRCSPGPTRSASASPPTRPPLLTHSAGGLRTSRGSASAEWLPWWPCSTTRSRFRRSLWSAPAAVALARPTMPCPIITRRRWAGCWRVRCPIGPTGRRVAEFAAAGAQIHGDDLVAARAIAARIWDRTPGSAPPVQMANQMGMVFARLDCKPRWRERLPEIEVPARRPRPPRPVLPGRQRPGDRARSPGHGSSSARRPPLRSPMWWSARSPRRCSRSNKGQRVPRGSGPGSEVPVEGTHRSWRSCVFKRPRETLDNTPGKRIRFP
jgi:hypothetical protein